METKNHSERAHALLSASGSARWLACTPSAIIESEYPEQSSVFAEEGTKAHELAELALISARDGVEFINPEPTKYDNDMEYYAKNYAQYIMDKVVDEDSVVLGEQKLSFEKYVPDGFGTIDAVIVADRVLTIIDYKYGRGVEVSAVNNPQLRLYALACVEAYSDIYDFDEVNMCIYQPRKSNISEDSISVEDLVKWGTEYVIPRAKLASKGLGDRCAGDHCKFCKHKAKCVTFFDYATEAVADLDFENLDTEELSQERVEKILSRSKDLTDLIKVLEAKMTSELLNGKTTSTNFKVVEGRSTRVVKDEEGLVNKIQEELGLAKDDLYDRKLKGLTDMAKTLGLSSKEFDKLAGDYLDRPQGKPTLAKMSDKRKEYQGIVANDFDVEE